MARIRQTSRRVIRAAATLVAVMLLALLGAGLLIVREAREAFAAELDMQIEDSLLVLKDTYRIGGRDALVATVDDLATDPTVSQHVSGVFAPDGTPLAGRIDQLPAVTDRGRITLENTATGKVETYHVRVEALADGVLVVGRSTRLVDRTVRQMQIVLPVIGLFLVIGISGAGMIVHGALAGELTRLEVALRRFAAGQMAARVALDGPPRDKIEDIAALVNAHLDQLQTSIAATERTAAAIAHDLRTPLTRASLQIQAVAGRDDMAADAAGALDEASAELEHLSAICDAILRISTIEATVGKAAFSRFDLGALAGEIAESYGPVLEDAGMRLDWVAPAGPVPVTADRRMIAQVIVNLLTNVMAHCPKGSTASLRVSSEGGKPGLSVSDDGPGVPEAERDAIFEPFRRLDPSRSRGGAGLGLALVRAAARHHGAGLAALDARPGLRVTLTFAAAA
jgi:signal transduction histidine kinase